ncbi:MAG: methyltransferase domain-containing protein [Candidatus Eisenbacteria bacterium]|nr:methyltransferase domain-containing protein [Candidatus Eisenbacteria bacterium]
MTELDDARARARTTYNAAADSFDDPANTFWERYGRATIERLAPRRGDRILDVCCGSGASAIPAAETVGDGGRVIGVDLAEHLLALARRKAEARGLRHVEFRAGDMLDLRLPESPFDAVVCVFWVFFVPDIAAAVRALWREVAPGGALAVTTWGPRFFEPVNTVFWDAVREVRPDLYKGFNPWDRICDPASLAAVLRDGGVATAEIVAVAGSHPIATPEVFWTAVRVSGYRGTPDRPDGAGRERVRAATVDFIARNRVRSVETNVVYALARKP